ncbi:MAG: tRNA epoxyqueuosine(34) reductase QueG [Ignavibacteria bacterium]|nr:tRNA epoxyqueuosine(34) reductase QueG [Ignavibacteria bacterium]
MVNPVASVTARIKSAARELGFAHAGIARAEALEPEGMRLLEWLRSGRHAGMAYMERDPRRRSDPREVLPGARSVISVSANYYTPQIHPEDAAIARISRYAWGDDYHDVLLPRLRALEERVKELVPDAETRGYVDTGPVMDKAWAVRAGIGWLGKHGNVITRDRGSWVFLATILTTAALEYDVPIADFCGSCTRCIDACPTAAIPEPYVVDANRCIPYLTIELKGDDIPGVEDMDFKSWIFGCDICQDVCPWNSFAVPSGETAFAPRPRSLDTRIEDVLVMGGEEFRERFRKSPVARTKHSGLRRNARILLRQRESHGST